MGLRQFEHYNELFGCSTLILNLKIFSGHCGNECGVSPWWVWKRRLFSFVFSHTLFFPLSPSTTNSVFLSPAFRIGNVTAGCFCFEKFRRLLDSVNKKAMWPGDHGGSQGDVALRHSFS